MAAKNVSKPEAGLQAVLLADNFNISAVPLGISWALLPLAGARLIDYTIEFLLRTPVEEVIIFSVNQAPLVEKYVKDRWVNGGLVSFRVVFMSSQSCRSMGDALRDIDSKALIKSDFLLTQAGFVSNFDFESALTAHKSRRIKDKNAVLTLLYSECSINHPSRVRDSDAFLVLDSVTNRLLHCQHFSNNIRKFEYPLEVLTMNDEVTTRFDLLDCNMAICSAQIPPQFADNFDFQTRRHLIREILTNEEILAYRVFVHVVEAKFAAFVGDLNSYLSVSQSLLERWCHPIAPDALNGMDGMLTRYSWRFPNVYVADRVKRIAKSARLERNVLVGPDCDIADNCELNNVVMGKNCVIGPKAIVKNCILWDGATVEANSVVENSILCEKSRIGQLVRISGRCIVGTEVSVPSNVELGPGTILCKTAAPEDSDIISEPAKFDGKAYRWRVEKSVGNGELWPPYIRLEFGESKDEDDSSSTGDEGSGSDDELNKPAARDLAKKANGISKQVPDEDDNEKFSNEVLESLKRGYAEQIACDNLIMEINSSKHAYNVRVAELQRRVMTAILETAMQQNRIKTDTAPELVKAYQSVLSQFLHLINNYFKPKNHSASNSASTQLNCLAAIKEFAQSDQRFVPALSQVLYFLYDKDIFEEDVLLPWCNQLEEPFKSQIQSFIQWLEEAEEESSDDDD